VTDDVSGALKAAIDAGEMVRAVDPVLALVLGGGMGLWLTRFFTPKGLVTKEDFNEVTGQLRKDLDKCDDERAEMMKMLHEITMTLQGKAS
jgi:hypothetical protein